MSVDVLPALDVKAVTLRVAAETQTSDGMARDEKQEIAIAGERRPSTEQLQAETIARLRQSCELNRARARRLISTLRRFQADFSQAADSVMGESIDQRMSRLLERDAKTRYATTERAQLAAMRELSQWNARRLLNTHFRRHLWQVTASKGVIVPLALLAGAGLLTAAQSGWPAGVYPAIFCFALAAFWGWRYVTAAVAPLRRQLHLGHAWRSPGASSTPAFAAAPTELPVVAIAPTISEKSTVADLLAAYRPATAAETSSS